MRVLSVLLLALFLFSSCNQSVKLDKASEVSKALSSKWETTYMETRSGRFKIPEAQIANIVYNENGTYSYSMKGGSITKKGEWNYDPKTQVLYRDLEKGPGRVLKLTNNELIMADYLIMNDKIVDSFVITYKKI